MNKADLIKHSQIHKIFKPFYSVIGHVLAFHRVFNQNNYIMTRNLQISSGYLESVIKFFINNNIDIVSLDECHARITAKGKVKRFVTFTFDDGYADNLTHALPVFEKYNVPFSIFLTTGIPDHKVVLWWYLLEDMVFNTNKIIFNDDVETYCYDTLTLDQKRNAFSKIKEFIKKSNQQNLLSRLKAIFKSYNCDLFELTKKLGLSWEQIVQLSNHPLVTIGAHTVNHLALSKLEENEVFEEIIESAKIIESRTGKSVLYFAYPFGSYNEASFREFNIVRNFNFKMAFIAKNGNIFKKHANYMTSIPRITLNENWSTSRIDLYINGIIPFLDKFR